MCVCKYIPWVSCNFFDNSGKPTGSGSAHYTTTRFYMSHVVIASFLRKSLGPVNILGSRQPTVAFAAFLCPSWVMLYQCF